MRKARSAAAFSALSLMLLAGQAAPVLAVESPAIYNVAELQNGSITIKNPGANLTYTAYQLFTGSWHDTQTAPNKLSEVQNGTENEGLSGLHFGEAEFGEAAGANGEYLINAINAYKDQNKAEGTTWTNWSPNPSSSTKPAQQTVEYIEANADLQTAKFANFLNDYLTNSANTDGKAVPSITGVAGKNAEDKDVVTFGNLKQGYYLIGSTPTDTTDKNHSNTTAMLVPVNTNVTVTSKSSVPTVDKKVKDNAGDKDSDWKETASVGLIKPTEDGGLAINDIAYMLTGYVAHNIEDYSTYEYSFVDTMPKKLTIVKNDAQNDLADWTFTYSVKGYVTAAKEVKTVPIPVPAEGTTDYRPNLAVGTRNVAKPGEEDDIRSTLTWSFSNLRTVLDKLGIDYSYEHAKDIEVIIEYKPAYTPAQIQSIWNEMQKIDEPQINSVYVEFSNDPKTNGKGETPENDAKVYSFNLDLTKTDGSNPIDGAEFTLKAQKWEEGKPVTDTAGKPVFVKAGTSVTVDGTGKFNFTGLDADVLYQLTESGTPDGYKKIEPIEFWIESIYNTEKTEITGIKVHVVENKNEAFGVTGAKNEDGTFTFSTSATAAAIVVNTKGPNMPVTGQAGIWTGVAVGGLVLAVSAVAILKNKKEEA